MERQLHALVEHQRAATILRTYMMQTITDTHQQGEPRLNLKHARYLQIGKAMDNSLHLPVLGHPTEFVWSHRFPIHVPLVGA